MAIGKETANLGLSQWNGNFRI